MPIKAYVSRDSEGRPWPPDYDHEAPACIDVTKRLWKAFASQPTLYAVGMNLHQPSADFVTLSEHGIGVLEFKHHFGRIRQMLDGTWYANHILIRAGAPSQGYKNPRFQVQAYAEQIRDRLIHPEQSPAWLPGNPTAWSEFKFQTGVCFTHPAAHITNLEDSMRRRPDNLPWEDFSVLAPGNVPDWAASLRFEANQGRAERFEPYRLTPAQILDIVTRLLGLVEWTEIINLMPTGAPYAYVSLVEGGHYMQVFGLDRDEITCGRNVEKCSVLIPERYTGVSRIHACIMRTVEGVYVTDLNSKNGTFVNRQRVTGPRRLEHNDRISLGGIEPNDKVCLLVFTAGSPVPDSAETT